MNCSMRLSRAVRKGLAGRLNVSPGFEGGWEEFAGLFYHNIS